MVRAFGLSVSAHLHGHLAEGHCVPIVRVAADSSGFHFGRASFQLRGVGFDLVK
jgi:hypothetical protein